MAFGLLQILTMLIKSDHSLSYVNSLLLINNAIFTLAVTVSVT